MKSKQDSFELDNEVFNTIPYYAQATPVSKTKLKSMNSYNWHETVVSKTISSNATNL